jgi:uncharacterized protein (DUF952 family)
MDNVFIYHIIPEQEWNIVKNKNEYSPTSLAVEGFIHFSYKDQVIGTAERYYADKPGLVILKVSIDRVKPEIRNERSPTGGCYPHLYGPLDLNAVVSVQPLTRDDRGKFTFNDLGEKTD